MPWLASTRSHDQIDAAGTELIRRRSTPAEVARALEVINEWRMAHAFPLNTIQMRLRDKVGEIDRRNPFVSQRIKRMPAIESKLRRLKNIRLSEMQDLGGCRAVVASMARVVRLADDFRSGRIRHELERINNYIESPRSRGYRSLHLIYRYYSDRNPQYDGQRIEMQLRTRLQHAWATAVETVDTFTGQGIKVNLGRAEYARFFSLMGGWIAYRERTSPIPDTPDNLNMLLEELRELSLRLNIEYRLRAFRASAPRLQQNKRKYHILDLNMEKRRVRVVSYDVLSQASAEFSKLEKQYRIESHKDVLLASVHGATMRRAYPNYFADTGIFLRELTLALSRQ